MEITFILFLLVLVIVLFATDRISVDLITAGLLLCLTITGILTPGEAFEGFGSDFIIMLISLFIISNALHETGFLDMIGGSLLKIARMNNKTFLFVLMSTVSFSSAFMNNTTVTAIYLSPVMALARKLKTNASKLLMPMAYASIIGGTCTIIGTSTNIAVNGYLIKHNIAEFGMFDLTAIGIVLCILGILYMVTIGRKILPDHKDTSLTESFHIREYMSEIVVTPGSKLIGQQIAGSRLSTMGFRILNIIRDKRNIMADPDLKIEPEDILIVEGKIDDLLKIKEENGIEIRADVLVDTDLESENIRLAEMMVTAGSELANSTVKQANFRQQYGLVVLAINREGHTLSTKIGDVILRTGDMLLVQGSADNIRFQRSVKGLAVVEEFKPLLYKKRKAYIALSLFILGIIAGSMEWIPLPVAFMAAAFAIVVFRCISIEKAYASIDWRLIILIAGMSAFGTAMLKTGTASFLAENITSLLRGFGNYGILAGFVFLTVILTQPLSNAAAALVVLPIALQTADILNVNPHTYAAAVMLSASVSLITPFEPSCILVYGPGKYKFFDFIRVGSVLTLLLVLVILLMVPFFYPF